MTPGDRCDRIVGLIDEALGDTDVQTTALPTNPASAGGGGREPAEGQVSPGLSERLRRDVLGPFSPPNEPPSLGDAGHRDRTDAG